MLMVDKMQDLLASKAEAEQVIKLWDAKANKIDTEQVKATIDHLVKMLKNLVQIQ
jgi:hypothetical protein